MTQTHTNDFTGTKTLTVTTTDQPTIVEAFVNPKDPSRTQQQVDFKAGPGYFFAGNTFIESSGSAVRGYAVSDANSWATFSNTPGSRLDGSLGAPSLQHSYIGVASFGKRSYGRTGDMYSHSVGFFGGESTTNMPTSGRAEYAGAFEGIQEYTVNGSALTKSDISGKANLAVDFGARTVRGRIDDIHNHGAGPVKVATDYSLGYSGAISNSSFAGTAWMTHKNSDTPRSYLSQNSGTLQGGFFGPGATEAAGAIGVSVVGEPVKYLITGAFGAKRR